MAQLIKLQDYISRYQKDLNRYSSQFVRLKKIQWDRMKHTWENGDQLLELEKAIQVMEEDEKPTFLQKLFRRKKEAEEEIDEVELSEELLDDEIPDETVELDFEPNIVYHPQTLEDLKRMYMDQLFHFQLKWASSTMLEQSYVDPKFLRDSLLRLLTQKLPDNLYVFYYPILQLKKAPIELDVLILTPTEALCIRVLEEENMAAFIGSSDRFWLKKVGKSDKKVINPTISLNRMESILQQLFAKEQIDVPIRKVILSRNGYIDYPGQLFGYQFVDKRNFAEWFQTIQQVKLPLKHMQVKAASAILQNVQTTSYSRAGWRAEIEETQE